MANTADIAKLLEPSPTKKEEPSKVSCEHKFVHLKTKKSTDGAGGYSSHWRRVDLYFCEKCLEQREVVTEDWSRDKPWWY